MPETLNIGIFVLGAVMLLLALVSGGFKIFGSEMPGIASRPARIIAFIIGVLLIGFALFHFKDPPTPAPKPPDDSSQWIRPAPNPAPGDSGGERPAPDDHPTPHRTQAAESLNDPSAVRTVGREAMDFGVSPRNTVEDTVFSNTPLTIPGVQTLTTGELYSALTNRRRLLLLDVLKAPHAGLPGARRYPGVGLADPSPDFLPSLEKDSGGDKAFPIVIYCEGPQCWESYNAALRARDAGYTNVYWYRGGLEAWVTAGLPTG